MRKNRHILRQEKGVGAVEFALTFPLLLIMLIGSLELGMLFMSSAGLTHGVNEAARYATIFPTPSQDQIKARITSSGFGRQTEKLTLVTSQGEDPKRGKFITITATYNPALMTSIVNMTPPVLTETRKVWITPDA